MQQREAELARKLEEVKRREWLRVQRSRPRIELQSEQYPGESIYVHQTICEKFMKNRGIQITSYRVEGGMGGKLILEYATKAGGRGKLELLDLGPMPVKE